MIFWPIFFVAAANRGPTFKPRNFKKSAAKGAEVAKVMTLSTSARFGSSFRRRAGSFKRGNSTMSSKSSKSGQVGSISRRASFANTEDTSGSSRRPSLQRQSLSDLSGLTGSKPIRGSFSTSCSEVKAVDDLEVSLDSTSGATQHPVVKLVRTETVV